MNKKLFSPYIRTAMFSTLTPPFKFSDRIIFDYEIILVTDGKCRITIDNTPYLCEKNRVVFIRPGVRHKFECVDNSRFVQPHIHFDVSYDAKSEERFISFKQRSEMSERELALICEDVLENVDIPCLFKPYDMEKFKKIFFEIIEIFQKKAYNYELLYKAKMLELLDCILTQFDSDKTIEVDDVCDTVVSVKNYIDNNYLHIITLDSLSEQFYMNKYTLMRKFKSLYKQGIIAYYREKRMKYAENILRETTLPVYALSEKLNFSDIYSFSRSFKAYAGCSPADYRKKHRLKREERLQNVL